MKDLKPFFFDSVGVCSKIVGFISTSLIFLLPATSIVVASVSAVHSSFKGDLNDLFLKKSENPFFRFKWFPLKMLA